MERERERERVRERVRERERERERERDLHQNLVSGGLDLRLAVLMSLTSSSNLTPGTLKTDTSAEGVGKEGGGRREGKRGRD